MTLTFAIAGKMSRDYLLPPVGNPLLDSPGGSLLYAAGGLAVWDPNLGLIGRIDAKYPQAWLDQFEGRGFDVQGIRRLREPADLDLRRFTAYNEKGERTHSNAVSHFARRQLEFPKSLLGYLPPDGKAQNPRESDPLSPTAREVPSAYRSIPYIHLCPLDFTSQSQLVGLFKGGADQIVSLDPAPGYMKSSRWRDLRVLLQGLTVFQPSEEELRALFWGETNDLWEMAAKVSEYDVEIVVIKRGMLGQLVYDSPGKHRYEIPAYPARVADPTGAGHAFCGGFLAGLQRTNDPLMAALYGNVSASLKLEGSGPFYPLEVMPGLADARLFALQEMAREV